MRDLKAERQRSENHYCWHCDLGDAMLSEIERLEKRGWQKERERCAKIAEECASLYSNEEGEIYIAHRIADMIREG